MPSAPDAAASVPELPSLGGSLAPTFLALTLVCVLAYVLLRWLARRGWGGASPRADGPLRVVARTTLDPRRSVYVLDVAGRGLVVGVGEGASMTLLTELSATELEAFRAPAGSATPSWFSFLNKLVPPRASLGAGRRAVTASSSRVAGASLGADPEDAS